MVYAVRNNIVCDNRANMRSIVRKKMTINHSICELLDYNYSDDDDLFHTKHRIKYFRFVNGFLSFEYVISTCFSCFFFFCCTFRLSTLVYSHRVQL